MPHGCRIAEYLLTLGAVRLSSDAPFTWTSGIHAPIYCDNRLLYGHTDARDAVVEALVSRVKNLHIEADAIAGTATAAIGWGALVADRLHLPFVYVRSKPKEHGTKKFIEGALKKKQHVVLIEDLISTGKSSAAAVQALREEGEAFVTDVVSIFSYELLSGRESMNALKIHSHSLCSLSTLLDAAVELKQLTTGQAETVQEFSKDPEGWASLKLLQKPQVSTEEKA
jgi:orotate phosphoribosyltransferase